MALAQALAAGELPLGVRQMAAVLLRQYAAVHWSQHADDFVPPEPPPEVRRAGCRRVCLVGWGLS